MRFVIVTPHHNFLEPQHMPTFELHSFFDEPLLVNIIDIGALHIAGHGTPCPRLIKTGKARITGFEPNPVECERLNRLYGAPHAFYPYFIGDGRTATFYETNWSPTGSLFMPNRALVEKFQNLYEIMTLRATHEVQTKRLDDIAEISEVDFIKVDVQGAELSVFEGGGKALAKAVMIKTEVEFVELYEKQPLFADIDKVVRAHGFQFHTFTGFGQRCFKPLIWNHNINAGIRQLLWADAIYVRDWMALADIPLEKLKKLAVLLHDEVESYDLCHFVLEHIDARSSSQFASRYLQRLMATNVPLPSR
jgi:FkbM family methyltransferase